MKCCVSNGKKPYLKVMILGIIATVAVSSIYSWLANVNTIYVSPNGSFGAIYRDEGIGCVTDALFYTSKAQKKCNNLAKKMANYTNAEYTNVSKSSIHYINNWDCSLYTDYSNNDLIFTFDLLFYPLIILFIFSFLYGSCAIVHDWSLIYNTDTIFYPSNLSWEEAIPLTYVWSKVGDWVIKKIRGTHHVCLIQSIEIFFVFILYVILIGPLIPITFFVDIIWWIVIKPAVILVSNISKWCCGCNPYKRDRNRYGNTQGAFDGCIDVSEICVVLSRYMILTTAISLCVVVSSLHRGLRDWKNNESFLQEYNISSHDYSQCECYCNYYVSFLDEY